MSRTINRQDNFGGGDTTPLPGHRQPHTLNLNLPPLEAVAFKPAGSLTVA